VRSCFAWLLALAVLVGAAPARAEGDNREEARRHYERGLALTNAADYAGALEAFREAYTKSPHFLVLYNVGQAEVMLGHPIEAVAALRRYLNDGGAEVPATRRQEVEAQIAALEAKLAELTVTTDRAGLLVLVDDKEIGRSPLYEPLRVAPGRHVVTVKEGEQRQTVTVDLAEAERRTVSVVVSPPPVAPPPAAVVAAPKASAPPPPPAKAAKKPAAGPSTETLVGYAALGTGIAVGGAALAHFFWNRSRYDNWKAEDAALKSDPTSSAGERERQVANNELAASIEGASRVTVTLSVVGAALAAGGAVLLVMGSDDDSNARPPARGVAFALTWAGGRSGGATAWASW